MRKRTVVYVFILLLLLGACGHPWQAELPTPAGGSFMVDRDVLKGLSEGQGFAQEVEGRQGVPLERVLVAAEHGAVSQLVVVEPEGGRHAFVWAEVAERAYWLEGGQLWIGGQMLPISRLEVEPPVLLGLVQAEITDIAPTVAAALGLPAPAQATGKALEVSPAGHVLLLFLDAFGYVRYIESLEEGLIPHLAALGEPLVGLTTYPPITSVASASVLTGASPSVHGADRRGIRKTEVETILDVVAGAGRRVVAVEGDSLSFTLRNADTQLSGDRDGDGHTDDNVLANTLAVLEAGMPDLLWVHFHGIDDAGHSYGPGTAEERARIRAVDEAVGQILAALPPDVLVIIFADHGMHSVQEEGRLGNHGHLIERDIFIPVWVVLMSNKR